MRTCSIYLLLLLAGIFASCDDFLDQSPKYNLTLENAVTDYNGAKNIVNGMYSVIAKSSSFGGELAGKWASQAGIWDYNSANYNMTYKEGGTDFASIWQSWYGLVNSANAAVIALTNLDVKLYPSPETKEALIAEARCMRAWAYANLFWMFGHWWEADDCAYGILYRDQMANLSNLQVPRITVGESYRKIFEDLEPGLKHLPDFTTPRYLSKQLAQVLKAKLLLNRGVMRGDVQDLKDALDLVLTVKKDAPGSWKMEADLAEMYEKGWESGEVLWTRYMGDITNCAWSEFTYSYAIGYNNTYYDIFDGWIKEDPRYTVVMDSVRAPETWDTKNVWALKKLYHGGRNDTPDAPYTAYYFRYAELYLMEAELKARLDDYSVADALAPLNEMRSKRTNPVLPALSASSKKELLRTIFREICVEQFLENGSEYFASLRFINDTDASPAQNKSWIYTLKQDVDFSADKYCWPIPEDERLKNKLADQNPGLGK